MVSVDSVSIGEPGFLPVRPSNTIPNTVEKTPVFKSIFTREKALALLHLISAAILEAGGQVDFKQGFGLSTSLAVAARAKTLPLLQAAQSYARSIGIERLKDDLRRQIEKSGEDKKTVDMAPGTISDGSSASDNDTATTHADSEPTIKLADIDSPTDGTPDDAKPDDSEVTTKAQVDDTIPPPETDPLKAFKTAVFGNNFREVLNPDPQKILRALERGEFIPDQTSLEAAVQTLAGYMKDTSATGKFSITFDTKDDTTLEIESSADTAKLIQILELALTEDKEVDVTSRESGRRLVDIMTKHTIYYLQENGFLRDGEPVDPHQLKQALYKVMVAKGKETGLNAGIIFEVKREEAQRDLAGFQRSLTLADQLFFGKIFDSKKCRRPAVFEQVIKQLTSAISSDDPKSTD